MHCMCWIPPCAGISIRIPIKKEHENLTGTNTWVIQFIADHKDGPVYLRDIDAASALSRSTGLQSGGYACAKRFCGAPHRRNGRPPASSDPDGKVRKPFGRYPRRPRSNGTVLTKGFTQNEKETMLTYLRRAKNKCRCCLCRKAAKERKERCRWLKN